MQFLIRFLNKINNNQRRVNRITLSTSLLDKKKLYGNNKNNNLHSLPLLKMNKNQLKLNRNQKLLKVNIKCSLRKMKTKILLFSNHRDQTILMILMTRIYTMPYLLVYLSLLPMVLSVIMQLLKQIVDC